jgi:hypothetical protein
MEMGKHRPEPNPDPRPSGPVLPSSPRRPPRYGAYITSDRTFAYLNWCELWAAASTIRRIIADHEVKWLNSTTILTSDDIKIRSDQLEDIMEYEGGEYYDGDHAALSRLRPSHTPSNDTPATSLPVDVPKRSRERTAPRRTHNSDLHTIAHIAQSIGMDPSKARSILRKRAVEKPYEWADPAPIIELLKKG